MLTHAIVKGSTDQSILVMLRGSADGQALTGLAYDTEGLAVHYKRGGDGAPAAIELASLADDEASHTDGGFVEVDASDMPGVYRLDLPDAAVADGAPFVGISITGASGLLDAFVQVPLVDAIDVTDGKVSVASVEDGALSDAKFQVRPYLLVAAVAAGSGTTAIEVNDSLHDGAAVDAKAADYFNSWKVRGVSGANKGFAAAVSDWGDGVLTVDTMPAAPADGDLFQLYKE